MHHGFSWIVAGLTLGAGGPAAADTFAVETKLLAPDGQADYHFGMDVALFGDVAIVGARGANGGVIYDGAAYLYGRHQGGLDQWGFIKKLTTDYFTVDWFGEAVSIWADTAVVGAPEGASLITTAHVFERHHGGPDNWGAIKQLSTSQEGFGSAVAISGDTLLVGAPFADGAVPGTGAVYVFERHAGGPNNWGQVQLLFANDGANFDEFGAAVEIWNDTAVVGAFRDDDEGSDAGAAYVFQCASGDEGRWSQVRKLLDPQGSTSDWFGHEVAIWGDTVVIGVGKDDAPQNNTGSVVIYRRDMGGPDNWGFVERITPSDAAANDEFGDRVSIVEDVLAVGARGDDDNGSNSGSVYVFRADRDGSGSWEEVAKLTASDGAPGFTFGSDVAVFGHAILAGSGNDDEQGLQAGSAYVIHPQTGDVDNDGAVGVEDLMQVVMSWGPCPAAAPCLADVNGDGVVDVSDLVLVVLGWR